MVKVKLQMCLCVCLRCHLERASTSPRQAHAIIISIIIESIRKLEWFHLQLSSRYRAFHTFGFLSAFYFTLNYNFRMCVCVFCLGLNNFVVCHQKYPILHNVICYHFYQTYESNVRAVNAGILIARRQFNCVVANHWRKWKKIYLIMAQMLFDSWRYDNNISTTGHRN